MTNEKKIASLQVRVESLENYQKILEETITVLNNSVEDGIKENKELRNEINKLKGKVGEKDEQIKNLQVELLDQTGEKQKEELKKLQTSLDSNRKLTEILQKEYQGKIFELEAEIARLKETTEQTKSETYLSLSNALTVAESLIDPNKDKENSIFEERRKARKKLQDLVEEISSEAKQAYQLLNKEDRIDNCIKVLGEKN
jgi:chromosome segregation ATPase